MPSLARKYLFLLGGQDLEMVTIRRLLLDEVGEGGLVDKGLAWGARVSDYENEIRVVVQLGLAPVAIELTDDMPPEWPLRSAVTFIDHHGDRYQEVPSLKQVFDLLRLPQDAWTRDFELVAANDVGHVRAMRMIGASLEEMRSIRQRDRIAQGITPEQELQGLFAIRAATLASHGKLLIIELPSGKTATVTDPLMLQPEYASLPQQFVTVSPNTTMFFGSRTIIEALRQKWPSGFSGGQGTDGFFGLSPCDVDQSISIQKSVEQLLMVH